MNDPVRAILDGLSAAGAHWITVAAVLVLVLTSQVILIPILYRIFREQFSLEEYLSLSLAGWLLPASILSLLLYGVVQVVPAPAGILILLLLIAGMVFFFLRKIKFTVTTSKAVELSLAALAVLFILLRLAFVSKALFPLYFDSAQHYRFIREILAGFDNTGAGSGSLAGYYHLGFHFLAALLTFLTRAEITATMLVLGQVMLALMPFGAFFLVRQGTGSNGAGFLALALAAFGWYMPAHAMDWGKYPALASLALIPFVIGLASLSIQGRRALSGRRYLGLNILLLAGVTVSVFLHSRSLVVYALLVIAWLLTSAWGRLGTWPRLLSAGLLIAILAGEILYIRSQAVLGPLLDAYGRDALLVTIPVLILSVFAWRSYPGLAFLCLAAAALILASLFVSLGNLVPGYAGTTLLDRPYVQMILFLPLTLLAGFGFAGLEQLLGDTRWRAGTLAGGLLILLVASHGLAQYDLYPSDCCALVSRDDLTAIDWLDRHLSVDALILTSSTDLKVLPTDKYQGSAGGDAGTWITPLTGRPVASLPYSTDFSQQQTLELLCQQNVGYVYVGKTGWYFNDAGMPALPGGYRLLLDLPKARVYQVTGCG